MNGLKKIISIILLSILFNQNEKDTTNKIPIIDFSKGFNIPGIIPEEIPMFSGGLPLFPKDIEAIKEKAKSFIPKPITKKDIIVLETNRGTLKLKFFSDIAPKHCLNFKKLANSGYYDGTSFHRIIPGFMIQGGDINSRDNDPDNDGMGGPGWTVDAEFSEITHKRGVLSMARSRDPNSAGSQFFICVADSPHLDGKYTVFGEVIANIEVIDHIVNTPTNYIQAKRMSRASIPEGEDPDDWIVLKDSKTGKRLYSKVPKYKKKVDYEYEMRKKISSDKPALPLIIKKIRVGNEN
ncbi:MAG: peptidylprolyl isomerase [Candidatus Neomarinimicrobiota bacterium]|nr:peptidylprolyl isomerase [Candidatus Neomarinimicrobiota bacterium]|tara:strand:+ start:1911 stop:2792 length:882 start_codon:yes stop_codon:yes gene_type:complete